MTERHIAVAGDEFKENGGSVRPRYLSQERKNHILEALIGKGSVTVSDVSKTLNVSEMTVRRDLIELETEGRLLRVHGGAVLPATESQTVMDNEPANFEERLQLRADAKSRIATAAAAIASRHLTIALDIGTTTLMLAERLLHCGRMKIFTNSIRAAYILGQRDALPDVYLAGGLVRQDEMAIVGPSALAQFEQLWFDVSFTSVAGLTGAGLYDSSFEETEMKRVYLRRSGYKVVLCDSAKFQHMSLVHIASLQDIDMLITDIAPPPALATALDVAKVEVLIAK
ncbi:DeoR/GlpR family DNA-binding transcription regulator [Brenneria uluponensis]|uniref:DeoR/GlpR family DNA-binding transcription regulator n=1 Tax=Brenneria uluponensis TaxID=3057057 RepID=UPI0028F033B1|nr:DeoR/GlpR family DNA-binding transcription regulator [Brenneria ulupoensis]